MATLMIGGAPAPHTPKAPDGNYLRVEIINDRPVISLVIEDEEQRADLTRLAHALLDAVAQGLRP